MDFLNPYASIDVSLIFVVSKTTRLVVDTRQYLPVFLLLIPSMILIISIIKSSIALSLGLVGALSIVRFRTPIKEPEELLYLFVAIAIGLGLGANQVVATIVGFFAISAGLLIAGFMNKGTKTSKNTFIDLTFPNSEVAVDISKVQAELEALGLDLQVKRVSNTGSDTEVLLDIANFNMAEFTKAEAALKTLNTKVEIIATQNARIIT